MSDNTASQTLDLDADRGFQERWWRVERVAWALMGMLILAALAGLTGAGGPLSRGHVQVGETTIDYPRIARWQSADEATIRFAADMTGSVDVLLSTSFAEAFDVETMMPRPNRALSTVEGQLLSFDLGDAPGTKTVTLSLRPNHPGLPDRGTVRIGDAPPATVRFVILP